MNSEYGGLRPTGRQNRDPSSVLMELESQDGFAHTAVVFEPMFRAHPALAKNVELVLPFLEFPMVAGVVDLSWYDIGRSIFVYPTGSVWTVNEILRSFHDRGKKVGARAALELATLGTEILVEAAATGGLQGCFSHGNINPWRVAVRDDGELVIFGYGLSQVEMSRRRENATFAIGPDSLRYCPPERLLGAAEDDAADTYALALVTYELITGKPLYASHDLAVLEQNVRLSEGATLLARPPPEVSKPVAEILARALIYDPDTRLTGAELADELKKQIRGAPGPSLAEVMADMAETKPLATRPRKKVLQASSRTSAFTPDELAARLEEEEAPRASGRWNAPTRRVTKVEEPAVPEQRRVRRDDAAPSGEVRRRNRTDEPVTPPKVDAPAEEPVAPPAHVDAAEPRRRLRRPTDELENQIPKPEDPAPKTEYPARKPEDPAPAPRLEEPARPRRAPMDDRPAAAPDLREEQIQAAETNRNVNDGGELPGDGAVRRRLRRVSDESPAAAPPAEEAAPQRVLRREDAEVEGAFRRRLRRDEP